MTNKLTEDHKTALKKFRERHDKNFESVRQYAQVFNKERKQLITEIKNGPATVPELAQKTGLPTHKVLWHIAGMRKYGIVSEHSKDGDYIRYAISVSQQE